MEEEIREKYPRRTRGQSLVIIAAAFVGLLAFIGLTVDMGLLLIGYGQLRRAVDAASIAAASQFREGYNTVAIDNSANEFLRLNNVNLDNVSATIDVCADTVTIATPLGDPALCTNPKRKLVRVTASAEVPFTFLPVIGFRSAKIEANSIAEAASMDVVLVIDISESMTFDVPDTDPLRDPAYCNNQVDPVTGKIGMCQPFKAVKDAAARLASWVLNKPNPSDEEDRLSVVVFSNGWQAGDFGTHVVATGSGDGWTSSQAEALSMIGNLKVYEPRPCTSQDLNITTSHAGNCSSHDAFGSYSIMCPWAQVNNSMIVGAYPDGDLSTCQTTNIGGGLLRGGNQFATNPRNEALWVLVLLTDGAANATDLRPSQSIANPDGSLNEPALAASLPVGYCPENSQIPPCRDTLVTTRHSLGDINNYDADDYAHDMADFVGCDSRNPAAACTGTKGQGALVFTVGLGQSVQYRSSEAYIPPSGMPYNIPYGDALLRYIAATGDDGNPATDPCSAVPYPILTSGDDSYSCGNYYFAEFAGGLNRIFDDIASRIFTRITH